MERCLTSTVCPPKAETGVVSVRDLVTLSPANPSRQKGAVWRQLESECFLKELFHKSLATFWNFHWKQKKIPCTFLVYLDFSLLFRTKTFLFSAYNNVLYLF